MTPAPEGAFCWLIRSPESSSFCQQKKKDTWCAFNLMIYEVHEGLLHVASQKRWMNPPFVSLQTKSLGRHWHMLSGLKGIKKHVRPVLVIHRRKNQMEQIRMACWEMKDRRTGSSGALRETWCHATGSLIRSATACRDTHLAAGLHSHGARIKRSVHDVLLACLPIDVSERQRDTGSQM